MSSWRVSVKRAGRFVLSPRNAKPCGPSLDTRRSEVGEWGCRRRAHESRSTRCSNRSAVCRRWAARECPEMGRCVRVQERVARKPPTDCRIFVRSTSSICSSQWFKWRVRKTRGIRHTRLFRVLTGNRRSPGIGEVSVEHVRSSLDRRARTLSEAQHNRRLRLSSPNSRSVPVVTAVLLPRIDEINGLHLGPIEIGAR
jgi:hypothetical protein